MRTAVQTLKHEPIYYPDTDGEPMAEGDYQRDSLNYLVDAFKQHFQAQPNVYVSGNLLIYYEEGNPRKSVAPDVFVVLDVPKHRRQIYQTWVEGKGPDLVIEITSHSTRHVDEKAKPVLYQKLGVLEYFQYDPTGDYLKPALRGQCLNERGQYEPMKTVRGLDGSVILTSALLGLQLRLESGRLRVFNPRTGKYLDDYSEAVEGRRQAEYQAELERQRADTERQRADQAECQIQAERQRAEAERQRADRLAAQLRVLGIDPDLLVNESDSSS